MAERVFIGTCVKASPCGTEAACVCPFCHAVGRVETVDGEGIPLRDGLLRQVVSATLAAWRMAPVEIDGVPVIGAVCPACCSKHGIR